jgi:PAS domain S-box-containing protein
VRRDATRAKRAAEALEAAQGWRAAADRLTATAELDEDGRICAANANFAQLVGAPDRALIGHALGPLLDDGAALARAVETAAAAGVWRGALSGRGLDGRRFALQAALAPTGEGFALAATDAHGLRRTAEELAETRRRLADAAEFGGLGAWEADVEAGVLRLDPAARRRFEGTVPPALPLAMGLRRVAPADRPRLRTALARARQGIWTELDVALRDVGEGRRTLRLCVRGRRDAAGGIDGAAGLLRDVTDSSRREAAIALHRERFETILEGVEALIFLKDRDGRLVMANRKYLDTARRGDVVGRTDAELWSDETAAALRAVDARVFATGAPFVGEERVVTREGEEIVYLSSKFLIPDERTGEPILCGIAADITEQIRMRRSLEESRRAAEEASQAKSRFLAAMSHEIRTPLNGVLGMAELLDARVEAPDNKRMIGVIRDAGETLLAIINDILDLSKIEADKLTFEQAPFDPAALLRGVAPIHRMRAEERGLRFVIRTPEGGAGVRIGDSHRIGQILHNLIGNAIKFTEAGSVEVTLTPEPDALTVAVADTGIGMDAAAAAQVFDEFAQADQSTTRRFGGTGLGLAIVKRLVDKMGGEIALRTAPGQGSTFTLRLPAPPAEAAAPGPHAATARPAAGLRVLAADDNPINRMVLEGMLERLGARITLAESGGEAVALRALGDFDVLLLDISMPDMDGVEALARIRRIEEERGLRRPPALAVTANVMADQIAGYLRQGFAGHLAKPLRSEELGAALLKACKVEGVG